MATSKSEYSKAYYQKNKSKWVAASKKNREQINAKKREAYRTNKKIRDYYINASKKYRQKNPEQRRFREILKRYGLPRAQYEHMLTCQGGKCAVCDCTMTKTPHVDHCHKTQIVRGLLCFNCNRAIGHLQDNPDIARKAASYLEKNK